jgi:hypothetical protein
VTFHAAASLRLLSVPSFFKLSVDGGTGTYQGIHLLVEHPVSHYGWLGLLTGWSPWIAWCSSVLPLTGRQEEQRRTKKTAPAGAVNTEDAGATAKPAELELETGAVRVLKSSGSMGITPEGAIPPTWSGEKELRATEELQGRQQRKDLNGYLVDPKLDCSRRLGCVETTIIIEGHGDRPHR